jgi:hypothetical protein
MEEHIRANAELVLEQLRSLSGNDFGYTRESVDWLEGYIERLRNSGEFDSPEMKTKLMSVFGSFLGECIIRCYGGVWTQHNGDWAVAFSEGGMAFPFAKVAKQLDNGLGDGISSFFRAIPAIFEDLVRPLPPAPKKPWWRFW